MCFCVLRAYVLLCYVLMCLCDLCAYVIICLYVNVFLSFISILVKRYMARFECVASESCGDVCCRQCRHSVRILLALPAATTLTNASLVTKVIPQIVSEINEIGSKSSEESRTDSPRAPFSFKQFKACGPKDFIGKDRPSAMFQWFDLIEVTFRQSGCPDNLCTVNATGVFLSKALDW
ncbi:hypothetical protein HanLR1_Chr17g0674781 [Helianthus annuus]|nr:hypothetical protein HanHA89_Chr17g0716251 [Helianthus annuus]KAJ0633279.1 hypothetical protein HanLR1_Chr17g0674781 [Helianthus annuus]